MCVLQYVPDPSGRQSAEAVRCRIDFEYALDPDGPDFHHSVPSDFRDRLTQGDRADQRLDPAPARLKDTGPVRDVPPSAPTSSPIAAPLIAVRFTKGQCRPCPVRTRCTTSRQSARNVGFPM